MVNQKKISKLMAPVGVVLVLIVIILSAILLNTHSQNDEKGEPTPSTLTDQRNEVEEEIKDGVYTNYTYGFRFEYPEIFDSSNPWVKSSGKMFFVDGHRFPQLNVRLLSKDFYGGFYDRCFSAGDGELVETSEKSSSAIYKKYNLTNICVSRAVPYPGKVEGGWSYNATIPVDNREKFYFLNINVAVSSASELDEWEEKFDTIINTFNLLEE